MWKYIFFQPFLLLLIGCHLQPAQSPETSCIYSRDTVIAGKVTHQEDYPPCSNYELECN